MSTTLPALDPKRTALLVMDYQAGILAMTGLADPDALLGRVSGAIADVRAHGGTIGYVRVAFTEDDWAAVPSTSKTFAAIGEHRMMHHEDPSSAIDARVAPVEGDIVVRKIRYGGMSTTDLDEQLRARGIDTLVLAGVSTSGVVLSTLIDAADKDYRVLVLSDAVHDPDQQANDVLLNNVFPSRADVIDTATLHTLLAG